MGYMLFAGDNYYPQGGWKDFRGWFGTKEEAARAGAKFDWWHVVEAGDIVDQG